MKRLLIIAGSDSGGGAGIQADIKTACAHNVFATTAITAVTAQNTQGVSGVEAISPQFVAEQINTVLDDIGTDVIKTGMLATKDIIENVAHTLEDRLQNTKLIIDPVMVSTSGHKLLDDDAVESLKSKLLPLATLITPNIPEAEILAGMKINDVDDMLEAASKIDCANILIKGGHLEGAEVKDILIANNEPYKFISEKLESDNTHGTGCTLASAIACNLAKGLEIKEAVEKAREYVHDAILCGPDIGNGTNKPLGF